MPRSTEQEILKINHLISIATLEIDEKVSYLLGLLWGDGCLYGTNKPSRKKYVYLGIKQDDFADIEHLFDKKWIIKSRLRKNRNSIITEAKNHDMNLGLFLYKNDYGTKSASPPSKILSQIPKECIPYFWRGYSDADGCFYSNIKNHCNQYIFAGSYDQDWCELENLLYDLNIKFNKKHKVQNSGKSCNVYITNRKDILKFGDFIYQGNELGFRRKFEKYQEIKTRTNINCVTQ